MTYVKIVGCILILIAPTIAGYLFSERYKNRVVELGEIQSGILELQNEVIFTHTPLAEAFLNIAKKSKPPVNEIFEKASDLLMSNKVDSVYDAFKDAVKESENNLNLKKEDINILMDLSRSLGESDVDGQKRIFNLSSENVKKQIKEAEILMKKNVKLYRYLGFSVGAMLVILVV